MKKHLLSKLNAGILKAAFTGSFLIGITQVTAFAQSTNGLAYKTIADGNWNNPAIWHKFDTGLATPAWVPVGSNELPDATAGAIEVGHEIDITAPLTADELLIKAGGGALSVQNKLSIP